MVNMMLTPGPWSSD